MSFQEKYLCGESMDMYKASQHYTGKRIPGGLHFYDDLQIIEHEDEPLNRAERLKAVEKPLLAWYHSRARSPSLER